MIVAILDRGIDYTHLDFRNADGTTRIKKMLDMSNVNPNLGICDPGQPAPIVYTEAQINEALQTARVWKNAMRWGTAPSPRGLRPGNGTAALPTSAQWAGMAPNADLPIVRMTSEYVPAHSGHPEQLPFQGNMSQALNLVSQEAAALGEPIIALMDSGPGPTRSASSANAGVCAAAVVRAIRHKTTRALKRSTPTYDARFARALSNQVNEQSCGVQN